MCTFSLFPHVFNISPSQMRELGFDGYAIDFVDCPHAMRVFLMRECQLHRTVRLAFIVQALFNVLRRL
jgi:hypothetical protein